MRRIFFALLVLGCFVWHGCGSSEIQGGTGEPAAVIPVERRVGRVRLTRPVSGATIRFLDAGGNLIPGGETTSNAAGVFLVSVALPEQFRITATTRQSETFSTRYESRPSARGWLEINAVTTLIDRHRQHHPELTLAESEQRVRGYFQIPTWRDLRNGVYTPRASRFNHSLFLRRARNFSGGLEAYLDATVSAIDARSQQKTQNLGVPSDDSPFGPSLPGQFQLSDTGEDDAGDVFSDEGNGVFNLSEVDDPDEPLPPDPPAVANFNTIADDDDDDFEDISGDVSEDTFAEDQYVLVENNLVAEESTAIGTAVVDEAEEVSLSTLASGFASTVGRTAVNSLVGLAFNTVFQTVLSQFGVGQGAGFKKLGQEIQQVEADVVALQNSVNNLYAAQLVGFLDTQYAGQADSLGAPIAAIQSLWGSPITDEQTGYSGAVAAVSLEASTVDLANTSLLLQDFLGQASEAQLVANLLQIQNNQLGINGASNSMMQLLAQKTNFTRYVGIFSTEQLIAQFNTYAGFQHQAVLMLVAIARNGNSGAPYPQLNVAQARLKQYNDSLKQQFSLLPFPLDGNVIYDRQSGLCIYNQVFPATSLQDAILMANTLEEGGIGGWQVASVTDLQQLTNGLQQPLDGALRALGLNTAAASGTNGYGGTDMTILTVEPQNATVNGFPNPFGQPITYNSTNLSTLATTSLGTLDADNADQAIGPFILVGGQPVSSDPGVYLGFNGLNVDGLFSGPVLNVAVSADGSTCSATTLMPGDVTDSSGYTEFENLPLDVSQFVFWQSSNPDVADVSNAPGHEGEVIRLGGAPAGTVTFTASRWLGNEGNPAQIGPTTPNTSFPTGQIVATATFTYAAAPAATLTSITLFPRNAQISTQNSTQQQLFVVGQFSDGTSEELTNDPIFGAQLVFASSDPLVTFIQPSVGVAGPVYANLPGALPSAPPTLSVTLGGLTDSTDINFTN